jgi:hypothetical protein
MLCVVFLLKGVEARVVRLWPPPPGVVTCKFNSEAPKDRWMGILELGATFLSSRFLYRLLAGHQGAVINGAYHWKSTRASRSFVICSSYSM